MAMETILTEAMKLTDMELELANRVHPPFVSMHEGYGIMLEEYDELVDQTKILKKAMQNFWNYIKVNDEDHAMKVTNIIEIEAQRAACEAIQTAAMAKKYRESLKKEFE